SAASVGSTASCGGASSPTWPNGTYQARSGPVANSSPTRSARIASTLVVCTPKAKPPLARSAATSASSASAVVTRPSAALTPDPSPRGRGGCSPLPSWPSRACPLAEGASAAPPSPPAGERAPPPSPPAGEGAPLPSPPGRGAGGEGAPPLPSSPNKLACRAALRPSPPDVVGEGRPLSSAPGRGAAAEGGGS